MATALLTRRLRPVDLAAIDAVAAALAGVLCFAAASAVPERGAPHEPAWLSAVTALAIAAPVAVRRRWPFPAAVVTSVAAAAALLTQIIPSFAAIAPACALAAVFYSLGVTARHRRGIATALGCGALVSLGLSWPMFTGTARDADAVEPTVAVLFGLAVVGPAFVLGFAVGERRFQAVQRGEQLMRQAAVEERLRVARELHDIVAHTMTLIVVKASIGNHVAEASPAEARDALRVIETTGRSAMSEVRRVLDMLREDTPYAPPPGLRDLPELAELATTGGVEVLLELEPPDAEAWAGVSEPVGLAVYRIVQEAVTNVVKHAAPARCHIRVRVDDDGVRVEVTDDGSRPARTDRVGHGLIGMRERVAVHGGTFGAGPRDGGGFAVSARLPAGGPA